MNENKNDIVNILSSQEKLNFLEGKSVNIEEKFKWKDEYNAYIYEFKEGSCFIHDIQVEAENFDKIEFESNGLLMGDWYLKKNENKYRKYIFFENKEEACNRISPYINIKIWLYTNKKDILPKIQFKIYYKEWDVEKPYYLNIDKTSDRKYLNTLCFCIGHMTFRKLFPTDPYIWDRKFPIHPLFIITIIKEILHNCKKLKLDKNLEINPAILYNNGTGIIHDQNIPWNELVLKDHFDWYNYRYPQLLISYLELLEKRKKEFDDSVWQFVRYKTGWWDIFNIIG